jgi:hypothetical protein
MPRRSKKREPRRDAASHVNSLDDMKTHYDRGYIAALYDALCVVRELNLTAPQWVIEGALEGSAARSADRSRLRPQPS